MLQYQSEPDINGERDVICGACGRKWHTHWPLENIHHACNRLPEGPVTELGKIFSSLGINGKCGSGCPEWIARMNNWGPNGCREHRGEILEHLNQAYTAAAVATKALALTSALWHGYPLTLDGLLELAIERAAQGTNSHSSSAASSVDSGAISER